MKKTFIILLSFIAMMAASMSSNAQVNSVTLSTLDSDAIKSQSSFIIDGNWNEGGNWSTGVVPAPGSNVVIMANAVIPVGYTAVANEVILAEGGSITVADGGQLRHNTEGLVVTMEKNIEPYSDVNSLSNYYLLGFPFSEGVDVPASMITSEGNDFYCFDPNYPNAEWRNNRMEGETIEQVNPCQGYLYANPEAIMLSLTGSTNPSYNDEVETVTVPYTEGSNNLFNGWALLSNPFTCDAYIFYYNSDNKLVPMDFMVYDANGELITLSGEPIAPMQGFFVKVTETTTVFIKNYACPTGAINGLFSVSGSRQVYFSRGNLQYQASTNTWRFAEHQYDYIGSANKNISSTYSGWIDLFCWATSGYHDSNDEYNVNYQPWSISTSTVNITYNYYGYGPSTNMASPNLTGNSVNYDWGVYNPINNGGNIANQWRVLTKSEWNYVFNTRTTASGIRYAKAKVNNINGVILLPDDWSSNIFELSNTNTTGASYNSNKISYTQWTTIFESAGAVFLPAAGKRYGKIVHAVGEDAFYWSSTHTNSYNSFALYFYDTVLYTKDYFRYYAMSVRLVRVAE